MEYKEWQKSVLNKSSFPQYDNGVTPETAWNAAKEDQKKEIDKLKKQTEREGKLILKMKDEISGYKRTINKLRQKSEKKK